MDTDDSVYIPVSASVSNAYTSAPFCTFSQRSGGLFLSQKVSRVNCPEALQFFWNIPFSKKLIIFLAVAPHKASR